jgi:hypothetical protein
MSGQSHVVVSAADWAAAEGAKLAKSMTTNARQKHMMKNLLEPSVYFLIITQNADNGNYVAELAGSKLSADSTVRHGDA